MNIEPVRHSFVVATDVDHAFGVFTADFGKWWPLVSHHIAKVEAATAIIEPHAGGRWYERGTDGSECNWGRVLVWDPPHRLVLAWQINATWEFDPAFSTEVELRFTPVGTQQTRVEFEHRQLEKFGAVAAQFRESIGSPGGWPGILAKFAEAAGGEVHS